MSRHLTTAAISVGELTCTAGARVILNQVSLEVGAGQAVALVGRNGAGKTTLISALCGLVRPRSGTVQVLGADLPRQIARVRGRIGCLFQESSLYEELTPDQNLRLVADLYRVPDSRRRIDEVLDRLELGPRKHERVAELSGGMKRRLAIARALLHSPELLLLDEPTLGVDYEARHQIWAHVSWLRSRGTTVVLTTNYLEEAEALAERVVLLEGGVKIEDAPIAGLIRATGKRLEVDCDEAGSMPLAEALRAEMGVVRVEERPGGLVAHLEGASERERVMALVSRAPGVTGLRLRGAELATVMAELHYKPPGQT